MLMVVIGKIWAFLHKLIWLPTPVAFGKSGADNTKVDNVISQDTGS
jgi:hypothetical protein